MKGYEGQEQIDIFNLDIAQPLPRRTKKQEIEKRKEKNKKALFHTLHISNILEKNCNNCKYNEPIYPISRCTNCPFYKELRLHGEGLMETTKDKIHKESWVAKKEDKNDPFLERLYKYQTLEEMEKEIKREEVAYLRESHSLVEIANFYDCDYKLLRCYINKHKLNKREDGTYYDSVKKHK